MLPLPAGPLVLPPSGDATCASLRRRVVLLAARRLVAAVPAEAGAFKRDPRAFFAALDHEDVLPGALSLGCGAVADDRCLEACLPPLRARLDGGGDDDGIELVPGIRFARHDRNPLAQLEDHPEKHGNRLDLGGHAESAWVDALREALEIVEVHLPEWWADVPHSLRRLVPVGAHPERHFSATYREAPGIAYVSLHGDPLTLAEAIVHETQHTRLGMLELLDPVLRNGRTEWTSSPVRPDLRPLMGVLLAAHAFVPVAALHLRLAEASHPLARTPRFGVRRDQVRSGNENALRVVAERGDPTPAGRAVLNALWALHHALPGEPAATATLPPG